MRDDGRVTAVFFGDGAADEGALYESINFSVLKGLPVVYVLEDNQWSVCSRVTSRQKGVNPFLNASPDLLLTASVDGNDVLVVYDAARCAVERARAGGGPSLIACRTYRVRGHAGAYSDAHLGYRSASEIQEWEHDGGPIKRYTQHLLDQGLLTRPALRSMKRRIRLEIQSAFAYAQQAPLPAADDASLYVFRERP